MRAQHAGIGSRQSTGEGLKKTQEEQLAEIIFFRSLKVFEPSDSCISGQTESCCTSGGWKTGAALAQRRAAMKRISGLEKPVG